MKELFEIPESQKRGVVVMLILLLLLTGVRFSLHYLVSPSENYDVIHDLDSAWVNMESLEDLSPKKNLDSLFYFDPNTVTPEQLQWLGLDAKTAKTWINFRNKGFIFRNPEDVKKVYGVKDQWFARIISFIRIENQKKQGKSFSTEKYNLHDTKIFVERKKEFGKNIPRINLNTADSAGLEKLPMIGPALARRILIYRELLGGFISKQQLREVYGLKEENYNAVEPMVYVDEHFSPRKIQLMKDDFKAINRHPYIPYEVTKKIVQFRKNARITKENIGLVIDNDTLCKRILPYLEFE